MLKENQPLITVVTSLDDVQSTKPSFIFVGETVPAEVTNLASAKKANIRFFHIASLDGQKDGSVVLVDNKSVSKATEDLSTLEKFISDNAYPEVGELNPEN